MYERCRQHHISYDVTTGTTRCANDVTALAVATADVINMAVVRYWWVVMKVKTIFSRDLRRPFTVTRHAQKVGHRHIKQKYLSWALSPELIPVYRQVGCHYFPVTFPAERHRPSTCTKLYCSVKEAFWCKQLVQDCYAALYLYLFVVVVASCRCCVVVVFTRWMTSCDVILWRHTMTLFTTNAHINNHKYYKCMSATVSKVQMLRFPYSLPSVGPGADPGVQTNAHINSHNYYKCMSATVSKVKC